MSEKETTQQDVFRSETTASDQQIAQRDELARLWKNSPIPEDELLFNLGMYTRSSLLVKFLVMSDLYKRILKVPGTLMEFGCWWGQNLVLFENLRAIYEPFNKQRRIIGFDTFDGYTSPVASEDKTSVAWADTSYKTPRDYGTYLSELLSVHEGNNVLGHIRGKHKLIAGDVTVSVPEYMDANPETLVALAYFDIGLYEPTVAAMKAIKPHLLPGSVILLDELTWDDSPGEAIAFKEVFGGTRYDIEKCEHYPSKTIVTIR